ncbi:MAG: hypothetical protein ACYCPS_04380 [Candidatus Saccharimonadales bacterium]
MLELASPDTNSLDWLLDQSDRLLQGNDFYPGTGYMALDGLAVQAFKRLLHRSDNGYGKYTVRLAARDKWYLNYSHGVLKVPSDVLDRTTMLGDLGVRREALLETFGQSATLMECREAKLVGQKVMPFDGGQLVFKLTVSGGDSYLYSQDMFIPHQSSSNIDPLQQALAYIAQARIVNS